MKKPSMRIIKAYILTLGLVIFMSFGEIEVVQKLEVGFDNKVL